jgi:copper chaperone CopZ
MNHHPFSRFLIVIALSIITMHSFAGIKWVDIGVNGLTCSACTRSVEMSVSKLYFVESVEMSLEKTEGRIYVKEGEPINLKAIAQAVVDAGFSVRFLKVEFNFNDVTVHDDGTFNYQGQPYVWLEYKNGLAKSDILLKLVDEDFLPRKEGSLWKKKIASTNSANPKAFHVVQEI